MKSEVIAGVWEGLLVDLTHIGSATSACLSLRLMNLTNDLEPYIGEIHDVAD